MLTWAYRHLAMVVFVAVAFALITAAKERWPDPWHSDGRQSERDTYGEDDGTSEALELVIPAGPHGHFMVEAVVDGTPLAFVIDTGASDIVLSPADARRIGFRPDDLRFTRRYQTANGEVAGAPVILRELRLGQQSVYDVEASVHGAPLPVSLLGMSFLRRLRGYEVVDGRLILRW